MKVDSRIKSSRLSLGLGWKQLLSLIVVVSGGFLWFFMSSTVLAEIASGLSYHEYISVLAINAVATAISSLVGAFFPKKTSDTSFLKTWMAACTFVSFIPLMFVTVDFAWAVFLALSWGITLGIGMPTSMEYLSKGTTVENRGRVSAIAFFATFIGIFTSTILLESSAYQAQAVVLGAFKLAGLMVFILFGQSNALPIKKAPSYLTIFRERHFLLYFSAWIMFSLVNYLSLPILNRHFGESFVGTYAGIESIVTAAFALLGGALCDITGRKAVIISGFVMLGLGYAVLGIFPLSLAGWFFYTIVDGIAWGALGVVVFMTIWADVAGESSSKKYFALGGLPLLLSNLLQKLVGPDFSATVPVTAVFSLGSLFLFLAVLPLIYAPETLPEKQIRDRELRQYVEKAKRAKEKYA